MTGKYLTLLLQNSSSLKCKLTVCNVEKKYIITLVLSLSLITCSSPSRQVLVLWWVCKAGICVNSLLTAWDREASVRGTNWGILRRRRVTNSRRRISSSMRIDARPSNPSITEGSVKESRKSIRPLLTPSATPPGVFPASRTSASKGPSRKRDDQCYSLYYWCVLNVMYKCFD